MTTAHRKPVDPKCVQLAAHLCADDPHHKKFERELAETIQEAVNDFLTQVDYELNEDQIND